MITSVMPGMRHRQLCKDAGLRKTGLRKTGLRKTGLRLAAAQGAAKLSACGRPG